MLLSDGLALAVRGVFPADSTTGERLGMVCQWISEGLLIALVCGLPWWFGGIQPWAKVTCSAVVLIAVLFALGAECTSSCPATARRSFSPVLWILLASLGFGAMQLIPLPTSVLGTIAPANESLWRELTSHPNEVASSQLAIETGFWSDRSAWPVSLYAESTKHDLALLCIAVGVFFVGYLQFQSDAALRALFIAVSACGAAFGFFGIAQQLIASGKIYGVVTPSQGGLPFAAFVNRNNAGGYLNLCLAACLGLLIWSLGYFPRRPQQEELSESALRRLTRSPASRPRRRFAWRSLAANIDGLQVFAGLASVIVLGAVLCTLSRGAGVACILSLSIAALASGWLASKNRLANAISWSLLIVGGIALTAWVGKLDDLQARAETLTKVAGEPDGRWGIWRDCLAVASEFWPVGSGLGTQRFIYRFYERNPMDAWCFHAENQYVEALVDGGGLGLGLLVAAVVVTFRAGWKLLRNSTDATDYALGLMGLFAISTQAIHALFDFGLYLPANMCLLALLTGIFHGRANRIQSWDGPRSVRRGSPIVRRGSPDPAIVRRGSPDPAESPTAGLPPEANPPTARDRDRCPTPWRAPLTTALAAALLLGTFTLTYQAEVEASRRSATRTPTSPSDPGPSPQQLRQLELALAAQPHHAEGHLQTARVWIDRYRRTALKTQIAQRPNTNPEVLWSLTAPVELHTAVRVLESTNRVIELEDLRASPAVRENLVPAVRHLMAARDSTPLLPEVHLLLSELAPVVSAEKDAGAGLERLLVCAPADAPLLAEGGLVALTQPNPELAARLWRQAITVEPQRFEPLVRLAMTQSTMQPHLEWMFPDDAELLIRAAREFFSREEERDLRRRMTKHAKEILLVAKLHDSKRLHLEGLLFLLDDQLEAAIDRLSSATSLKPLAVTLRFDLATALAAQGRTDKARDHVDFCVRMEPKNERYAAFLKQLIRHSLTAN